MLPLRLRRARTHRRFSPQPQPRPWWGATTAPAEHASAAGCRYPGFDSFLLHFGREIALQQTAVADPLISESVDMDAEPEPRMIRETIALYDLDWPVMPDPSTLPEVGREIKVSHEPDGGMAVLISTPDTSDQQTYHFAQRPCWQLVRIVDDAI